MTRTNILINSEELVELHQKLSKEDLGRLLFIIPCVRGERNIIYNSNNRPHTNESLQNYVGMASKAMFFKFIKRLQDAKVICKRKSSILGKIRVTYVVNPNLIPGSCTSTEIYDLFK